MAAVAGLVGLMSFQASSFNGFIGNNGTLSQLNLKNMPPASNAAALPNDGGQVDQIGQQDDRDLAPPPNGDDGDSVQ